MTNPITFIIGRDTCSGDSGGPLVARIGSGRTSIMYLYGVVSFGDENCDGNIPGEKYHNTFFFPLTALNILKCLFIFSPVLYLHTGQVANP